MKQLTDCSRIQEAVDLNLFMGTFATFVMRKTDNAMDDKKCSTSVAPKRPVDIILAFENESKSASSSANSKREEVLHEKSS